MKPVAYKLLDQLQKFPATVAQDQTLDIEELVRLYCYSLDLSPFEDGRKVAVYLLQKQSALLRLAPLASFHRFKRLAQP